MTKRAPQDPETKRMIRAFTVFGYVLLLSVGLAVYFVITGHEIAVRWTGVAITAAMIAFFAWAARKGWFRTRR